LVHGIAEHVERYDDYASWLNEKGFLVVAQDHMGHGKSIGQNGIQGYFHGGWFCAVEDTYDLLQQTMAKFPGVPYILFGHSMGSFIVRTILAKHPDSGIAGCIVCGTAWQPAALLKIAMPMCKLLCRNGGDKKPSPALKKLMFGSYNQKVEHVRTENDWLTRDDRVVDAYNCDPLCGFTATAGLYRDMMTGIAYIQKPDTLAAMNRQTPVLFVAGSADPVGAYGQGVQQAAKAFRDCGMEDVSLKLYPMCRHEILNEINNIQVYEEIQEWIEEKINR
jgi:alpha-beta hydrolase superfamily lysophospholipase